MSEEIISGIIEGEEKDQDVLNEYMLSTVSSIKEELLMKYPQEISEFYIYNKYNEKERILKIFVTLLKETKINYREFNINFLLELNEEYPKKAPLVFCFTDVIIIKYIIYKIVCE
jgi:ubiquitin-protein ligase